MRTRRESRKMYYWIIARDDDGKPYLVYGGTSEDSARTKALEMLPGVDFKILPYPTHNLARASSMTKGHRLEETHSLSKATKRMGHDKSIDRLRQKRQARQARRFQ